MKTLLGALLSIFTIALWAQETKPQEPATEGCGPSCEMPKAQKEHEWLAQLVGEWDTEAEMVMEPGKPPMKSKGTESGRKFGDFWVILEHKSDMMGQPFSGILTLGYNTEKKAYVGTWVDTMGGVMWQYTGSVDATGKILTLNSEGQCPMQPGKLVKFRETITITGPDEKLFTSEMEIEGAWTKVLSVKYMRRK